MKVKDVMHGLTTVDSAKAIEEAAKVMEGHLVGSLLVEENEGFVGVITERDILRKVVAKGLSAGDTKVMEVMSKPILTIDSNESIVDAQKMMDENNVRRLFVTEEGEIKGVISTRNIARNVRYALASKLVGNFKKEAY